MVKYFYDDLNRLISYTIINLSNDFLKIYTFTYVKEEITSTICVYTSGAYGGYYSYTESFDFNYNQNNLNVTIEFVDNMGFSHTQYKAYQVNNPRFLQTGHGVYVTYDSKQYVSQIIDNERNIQIQYDSKKGLFSQANSLQAPLYVISNFGFLFRVNNPILITDNHLGQQIINYEYNQRGYPIKIGTYYPDCSINEEFIAYKIVN